jgi:methionyl-tRNA synthetase
VRHLITSALPYINGVKHLGNLVGSMLPADVYARFLRARGDEVLYVCATDEHGTPAELAAAAAGLDVAEFCARQHAVQVDLGARFELSFDVFGRSSSPQNHELTQHFARRLDAEGFLEERVTQQIYSVPEARFLPDRYVVGTCPICGYENARGDQCENCTNVLDPTDLIEPRSAVTGTTDLEIRDSRHLFLLQSKLAPELRAWLETKADWPVLSRSIAFKWLDEGLKDRGITRDLKWGVPVDRPGFENKVFYVWFDAPIEYISATKEWADARGEPDATWRSWWFDADDVRYAEFMAKDNVPFHTIGFPSTILGSREPWKLVDYLKSFNWLTYYGGKFSTSHGVGVFMDDALDIMPADVWRYYLMANAPESSDASFTWVIIRPHRQQGPGGHTGQLCQQDIDLHHPVFRGRRSGRRRAGRARARADCDARARARYVHRAARGDGVPQGDADTALDLERGQRILRQQGALGDDPHRPRRNSGDAAHRNRADRALRPAVGTRHPGHGAAHPRQPACP